jgi:BirA family biotin operon repressor/biotin-[acetyl-CoA-carboxylase] ligase
MSLPADLAAALARVRPRLARLGGVVRYVESIGSTNDAAAQAAAAGAPEGLVIVAGAQTAGRGRLGRPWFSPPGAGLYVSIVLRPAGEPDRAVRLLTLASGVALAEAVRAATGLPAELKWPNDLVAPGGRRKLGGILAEATLAGERLESVVLGFGLNVSRAAFPPELGDRAGSLEEELGRPVDAAELLAHALVALDECYLALARGRAPEILQRWRALAPSSRGHRVEWRAGDRIRRGVTAGIDEDGALCVETPEGLERIVAGEVVWFGRAAAP